MLSFLALYVISNVSSISVFNPYWCNGLLSGFMIRIWRNRIQSGSTKFCDKLLLSIYILFSWTSVIINELYKKIHIYVLTLQEKTSFVDSS